MQGLPFPALRNPRVQDPPFPALRCPHTRDPPFPTLRRRHVQDSPFPALIPPGQWLPLSRSQPGGPSSPPLRGTVGRSVRDLWKGERSKTRGAAVTRGGGGELHPRPLAVGCSQAVPAQAVPGVELHNPGQLLVQVISKSAVSVAYLVSWAG